MTLPSLAKVPGATKCTSLRSLVMSRMASANLSFQFSFASTCRLRFNVQGHAVVGHLTLHHQTGFQCDQENV
jgi:hypothetical protein